MTQNMTLYYVLSNQHPYSIAYFENTKINAYPCNATISNSVNFDFPSQKIHKIILLKIFTDLNTHIDITTLS